MKTICKEQDFAYFRERCKHWITQYRLANWDFEFVFNRKDKDTHELARVTIQYDRKCAKIELFKHWDIAVSKRSLDATAYHEVMHVLLAPLAEEAEGADEINDRVREIEHDILRNMVAARFLPKTSVFHLVRGSIMEII